MTDLSRFINLLIEYGQKLQHLIHKKYRPFISSMINLKDLAKNTDPKKIYLTNQMIIFKLGIESKSTKCIETSLAYLYKLFSLNFIDLSQPNFCEDYIIMEGKVNHKPAENYEKQMRHEIVRWLQPLIHFKNQDINTWTLKIYEFLIGEPIIISILELCSMTNSELSYNILFSYFSYRTYLFEECYLYTERQIEQFHSFGNYDKIGMQIKSAMDRQEYFCNLMEKYVDQLVSRAIGAGGKYGLCVVCDEPADHYCKVTKASLCGLDCKKKHLELAEKQYKNYYQSILLNESLNQGFQTMLKYLVEYNSPLVLSVLAKILEKPHLFMLVKSDFKLILKNYLPKIIDKVYQSKNQQIFETIYFLMCAVIKWWPVQCLSGIDYFLRESILQVISDKRPNFRILMLTFKSLAKVFESGKTSIQIYINFDCEINQNNYIEKIMFELSRMSQDKFANANFFNKQEKIAIKNSCMTVFQIFSQGLNEYRKQYLERCEIQNVKQMKIRKNNLEKFQTKFNEHWSEGIKSLFNLNLVGLESDKQIVEILMSLEGLKKEMIDIMLFQKKCEHFLDIFMAKLKQQPNDLLIKLLQLYQYIPLTEATTIGVKKFIQYFEGIYGHSIGQEVMKINTMLLKSKNYQQFRKEVCKFSEKTEMYDSLYLMMLNARKSETTRPKRHFYRVCTSKSYIEVISSQVSLLQIPLTYLLETGYDIEKILGLVKELIPISMHSNWLSLLVKYSGIESCNSIEYTQVHLKTMKGIVEITMEQSEFILDWLDALNFFCRVHFILAGNPPLNVKKVYMDNRTAISQEISVNFLEKSLLNGSKNTHMNFPKFILSVLATAKEELFLERVFMLKQFFYILNINHRKYLEHFDPIFSDLKRFLQELKANTNSETLIYICDMIKQFLLNMLKEDSLPDNISLKYFELLVILLEKGKVSNQKDVSEFVMTCISMVVVHHYHFQPMTWQYIIQILELNVIDYKYQANVIIKKILSEKVKHLKHKFESLIKISFGLVLPNQLKSSVEAIRGIKSFIDFRINPLIESETEITEEDIEESRHLIKMSIDRLAQFLSFDCHETAIEIIFLLFDEKSSERKDYILTLEEVNQFMAKIFLQLEKLEPQNLERGEKIMNESLYWSVKSRKGKNSGIIKILERSIIGKVTQLSNTAIKCIKTYIQMINPREEEDWRDIEETLLNIIKNAEIDEVNDDKYPKIELQKLLRNEYACQQHETVNIPYFVHKCKMQMMAVELLPNDVKCLQSLMEVYRKKIIFNDNVLLRVAIWKAGLGNHEGPPDLLSLEELFSNRIMAILMRNNHPEQTLNFILNIFDRFHQASSLLQKFHQAEEQAAQNCNDENYQLFAICQEALETRKGPLSKIMGFILPKLSKYCQTRQDKKKTMLKMTSLMPFLEKRQPYVRVIRELYDKV